MDDDYDGWIDEMPMTSWSGLELEWKRGVIII